MNTSVFILRAIQLGISIRDLDQFDEGDVIDMLIESGNDTYDYPKKATRDDFRRF